MPPKATGKSKSKAPAPESRLSVRRDGRRKAPLRRSDNKWQEILTGAAHVFRRLGYANSTLEDVATGGGGTGGALYYYGATKSELLAEVLRQPAFDMTAVLADIRASDMSATEKAREAIAAHMRALASN